MDTTSPALIVSVSYGNDSIALIQWLHERDALHSARAAGRVLCVYAATGWASKGWPARVEQGEALARRYGFTPHRIEAGGGLVQLARSRKAWPRNGMQFCTEELKRKPIGAWMESVDPGLEGTVVIGIRREESDRRATWPEHVEDSAPHGYRDVWSPLVRVLTAERDALVGRAGFDVLPHRSRECYPCINSAKADLWDLPEDRIAEIEAHETAMGITGNGKPRTLFRPAAHGGAVGIREVVRWANSDRGAYSAEQGDLFGAGCDSGFCGS